MPKRKPTSTNYGTGSLRPWQRKDELQERKNIKRDDKRRAIREGKDEA
jgi:hypothetical protein